MRAQKKRLMNLEKYACWHYRKLTVKQQESDVCLNAESKGTTAFVRDDPFKRHLPWAWTASGLRSQPVAVCPCGGAKYSVDCFNLTLFSHTVVVYSKNGKSNLTKQIRCVY